jgi:DNA polymerase
MNKQQALEKISEEIKACEICPINKTGVPVIGEGSAEAKVVFIGEAPGKQEAVSGRPFIGRSGKLLRQQIRSIGLREEDVYITSPVKYLPNGKNGLPGGTPTKEDIAHGRTHLMKQLDVIDPKVIVLLGKSAAKGVLEIDVPIAKDHGKVMEKDRKQYFFMYHPAAAIRFQKFKKPFVEDFQSLQRLLSA